MHEGGIIFSTESRSPGQKSSGDRGSVEKIAPECTIYFTICCCRECMFLNVMSHDIFPEYLGFNMNFEVDEIDKFVNVNTEEATKEDINSQQTALCICDCC